MRLDLAQCGEVDPQEHGHDHEPNEHGDGEIDPRDFETADRLKEPRQEMPQRYAGNYAKRDPNRQVTFKERHSVSDLLVST